jgi:hypothetical protein
MKKPQMLISTKNSPLNENIPDVVYLDVSGELSSSPQDISPSSINPELIRKI